MKKLSFIFTATLLLAACAQKPAEPLPDAAQKPGVPKQEVIFEQEYLDSQSAEQADIQDDKQEQDMEMMMDSTDSPQMEENHANSSGQFTSYVDGVIGNGMESVLFFHAQWCPKCKANEEKLNAWYGANEYARSVYKIDYDTATTLKQQYGVVQQDTFVLIDGNGNEVDRASFPTEQKLQELIGAL